MSLKTKVKVGNITNLSDARYCAGMGAELLGFPVGTAGLSPSTYRQIIDWVSGPEFILEITQSEVTLEDLKENFPGHYVQIGKDQLHLLDDKNVVFIVSFDINDWPALITTLGNHSNVKYVEVSGSALDSERLAEIDTKFPVLAKLSPSNDLSHILSLNITGISLSGGEELRPGLKDYSALAEILEQLETD
jgi:phosphoribosylanthranilate isomerase